MSPSAVRDGHRRADRDDLGHAVAVDGVPRRLVSLVPSLSETLAVWGLASRVVGVTDWCTSPPGVFDGCARVRGTKTPDVEAIVALGPDLVVANEEENRRVDVERLRSAGVEVHVTAPRSLAAAARSLERLSVVVGAPEAGSRSADEIRAAVAAVERPSPPVRAFCPVWRDPWMAVGTDTIAGDLLRCAGFDVVPGGARYPRVDLEAVAAVDPDVVLLPDEPYEFDDGDAAAFDGWRASVHLVDGAALTWWGPRTASAIVTFAELARRARR